MVCSIVVIALSIELEIHLTPYLVTYWSFHELEAMVCFQSSEKNESGIILNFFSCVDIIVLSLILNTLFKKKLISCEMHCHKVLTV